MRQQPQHNEAAGETQFSTKAQTHDIGKKYHVVYRIGLEAKSSSGIQKPPNAPSLSSVGIADLDPREVPDPVPLRVLSGMRACAPRAVCASRAIGTRGTEEVRPCGRAARPPPKLP